MAEMRTIDDFLNYKGSEGGGGKRLKSWAKSKGHLNFWLHTKQLPSAVWYHSLPELVVRPDKDDASRSLRNVWNRQHVCLEDEAVLKKQRFRTSDGTREHPPRRCPICRMLEAIRSLVLDGKLRDTDVIFRFDGSDKPEENRVIHAGGVCGMWKREQSTEEKERLQKHGISMRTAWAENFTAKLWYVLVGVDQDDVASGVQVAVQTQLVGDKIKAEIRKQIASEPDERGNPLVHPYCIQLLYQPDASKFDDRYLAQRINRFSLTPEIDRLIRGEAPSIEKFVRPLNATEIVAMLQKHALVDLPWDQILVKGGEPAPAPSVGGPPPRGDAARELQSQTKATPSAPSEWGDPCDVCKAPMLATATKCGKCGTAYEIEPDAAPAPATAQPAPAPASGPDSYESDAVYDDEIPFD